MSAVANAKRHAARTDPEHSIDELDAGASSARYRGRSGVRSWARDRHCTFPGCQRTRFVDAHHVHHWVEGGETSVDNLDATGLSG